MIIRILGQNTENDATRRIHQNFNYISLHTTHVPLLPSKCPAHKWPDLILTECPYFFLHMALSCTGTLASSNLPASMPSSTLRPQPVAMHKSVWLCARRFVGKQTARTRLSPANFTDRESFIKAIIDFIQNNKKNGKIIINNAFYMPTDIVLEIVKTFMYDDFFDWYTLFAFFFNITIPITQNGRP